MKARSSGLSDIGKVRETNEDQFLVDDELGVYAVADGMGGHAAGEIASELAIRSLSDSARATAGGPGGAEEARRRIESAVVAANLKICDSIAGHADRRGMGTTMVVLLVLGERAVIGHVGDSRAYLLRDGRLRQLTSDHSWVNEQVKLGLMNDDAAQRHPMRNIVTRALGSRPEVAVDLTTVQAGPGDVFLLCSDGLNTMLSDDQIHEILRNHRHNPEAACRGLVEAANRHGGEDNVTVVVVRCEEVS